MKDFSIGMALVDYVPVVFFAVAAVILQRDFYNKMSKGAFALFAAGTIDVFCAGALKATYKLLYAAGVCDFEPLTQMFFPVQAIGFMLAGAGMVAMLCHKQYSDTGFFAIAPVAAAPEVFKGTFLFVTLMVLGLGGMNAGLCVAGVKLKKPFAVVCFALSFVFCLMMGYLSSRDFAESYMNWAAEGVNILGQGAFLTGTLILHKNGLRELKLNEAKE